MPRGSAKTIAQINKLTTRQDGNARAKLAESTTKIFTRVANFAAGVGVKRQRNEDGEWEEVPDVMTSDELRAASIIGNKVFPDRISIQHSEEDDFDQYSKEELIQLIATVVENQPELAKLSGIQSAVDRENTVKVIEPAERAKRK